MTKKINHLFGALLGSVCMFVGSTWAQHISVVTEQYPPYNYEENGKIKGVGTEVVEAVLKEAGVTYDIKIYPWARSLSMAETEENVLIYSISRTEKRENIYRWIGVIFPIRFYIYALNSRSDIQTMKDIDQAKPYRVGVAHKDALEQYFLDKKFPNIASSYDNEINIKRLFLGDIDLWPMSVYTANYFLGKISHKPSDLKKIHEIKGFANGDQYMAMSLSTDIRVVKKIQDAMKKIKHDGTYKKILSKYE